MSGLIEQVDSRFAEWKAGVDGAVRSHLGIGTGSLPDCPYYQWFSQGVSIEQGAKKTVKYVLNFYGFDPREI